VATAVTEGRRPAQQAAISVLDGWSEEQVCEWLRASDPAFESYVESFRDNHIDGRALALLSREDLADIGVKSVGHRLAILRARADLHPPVTQPATTCSSASSMSMVYRDRQG